MYKDRPRIEIDAPHFVFTDEAHSAVPIVFVNAPPLERSQPDVTESAMVRLFWCRLEALRIEDHQTRCLVTWLELFILFSLQGGSAAFQPEARKHLKVQFQHDFANFRARSKQLFRYAAQDSANLVIPFAVVNPEHSQPLAAYGLVGKLPKLNFRLALSACRAWELHAALCSFGCTLEWQAHPPAAPGAEVS